jgi:magnesium-transporting ATPase (P-type)
VLFFACFFAFTVGEISWLNRHRGIEVRKAAAFSIASNIICITIGFSVSLMIAFAILAMAWDGSLQNVPGGNVTIWAAVIFSVVSPIALLTIAKFFLLKLFKFDAVDAKLKYAILASLLFFAVVCLIPCGAAYLLFR